MSSEPSRLAPLRRSFLSCCCLAATLSDSLVALGQWEPPGAPAYVDVSSSFPVTTTPAAAIPRCRCQSPIIAFDADWNQRSAPTPGNSTIQPHQILPSGVSRRLVSSRGQHSAASVHRSISFAEVTPTQPYVILRQSIVQPQFLPSVTTTQASQVKGVTFPAVENRDETAAANQEVNINQQPVRTFEPTMEAESTQTAEDDTVQKSSETSINVPQESIPPAPIVTPKAEPTSDSPLELKSVEKDGSAATAAEKSNEKSAPQREPDAKEKPPRQEKKSKPDHDRKPKKKAAAAKKKPSSKKHRKDIEPLLVWNLVDSTATDSGKDSRQSSLTTHDSVSFRSNGGLDLSEGYAEFNDVNDVLEGLRKSREFLLVANVTCERRGTKKEQLIFSFSKDENHRNLTISQRSERYVLRLDVDGKTDAEVKFGKVRDGHFQQIVIACNRNRVECFVDGELEQERDVRVDFSDWKEYPITVGSRLSKDRHWQGTLHSLILLPTSDHQPLAKFSRSRVAAETE